MDSVGRSPIPQVSVCAASLLRARKRDAEARGSGGRRCMRARAVGSSKEEAGHRPRVFPGRPIPTVLYGTVFEISCRVAHLLQMLTEEIVTGFGCRPARTLPRARGPAFESRQGRKARDVGHPAQRALWGFGWRRRCSVGVVRPAGLPQMSTDTRSQPRPASSPRLCRGLRGVCHTLGG